MNARVTSYQLHISDQIMNDKYQHHLQIVKSSIDDSMISSDESIDAAYYLCYFKDLFTQTTQ